MNLGPLKADAAFDKMVIDKYLPEAYIVDTHEEDNISITHKGTLAAVLYPDEAGEHIGQVVITSSSIAAPRDVRVGSKIGEHHNWEQMTCTAGEGRQEASIVCQAFEEGRIQFLVAGDTADTSDKEALAELDITALVWNPQSEVPADVETEGKRGKKKKPSGDNAKKKAPAKGKEDAKGEDDAKGKDDAKAEKDADAE
jgi:hypothetical protein